MGCPSCGAVNRFGRRFCGECGAALPAACSSCGFVNEPDEKFCGGCGQALATASRTVGGTPAPEPASPQSYTPKHLAAKILAGRDALAGERKQVTVLFADVVGSTELIRDRDPEDAQRLLDGAVEEMMGAIHRYEGTVSRLMGDGLMAMFGAPVAHEDHAVRACYAGLAMLEAIHDYAHEVRKRDGAAIEIRVGLNSGEVIVRLISDDLHMDYTAMGQTVHLASRMEQLAKPGTALLSPDTLALVEGYVEVRPLGPTSVRGLDDPLPVFELIGAGAARTRLQAAAARGLTPFVGRDDERTVIDQALARAASGLGQVVALVGEPGVGKSRLVYEATRAATASDWLVLASGALSYGSATPYFPAVDLLKTYAGIESGDDATAMRERLAGRLLSLDRALDAIVAPLLALLDLPVEDASWTALDPPRRRRATLDAIKRLLLRQSEERPVLLVLEDLHWVDSETQALLDELVESMAEARLLLLVNYRPEYIHTWAGKSVYSQARLAPLESGSAEQLLQSRLGDDPSLDPLKHRLIERTGGNPLFLEESVRSLIETGTLVAQRGAYTLARDLREVSVPATVQAILAARIDRLAPEDKRLLQTAAVIGKDVPFDLLRPVAETGDAALRTALSRLQAAELLLPTSLFPVPEYTFKHALTHEVAYGSLLLERRRLLHARVVEAIERLYAARLDEHVERLAYHTVRAEMWERSTIYCQQAGRKAQARSANRVAVEYYEQAISALEHVAASDQRTGFAIDLRMDLRQALQPLGEQDRILRRLAEAESLCATLGDPSRSARVAVQMCNCLYMLGEHGRAVEVGQRALSIATTIDDIPMRNSARFYLGIAYVHLGAYDRAIDHLDAVIESLSGDLLYERTAQAGYPALQARSYLGTYLAQLGDFARGASWAKEAARLAEAINHPYSIAHARIFLGEVHIVRGSFDLAIPCLEPVLELCRVWDFPQLYPFGAASLGVSYAVTGRVVDGLPLLKQGVEMGASSNLMSEQSLRAAWLAEGYLAADHIDDAIVTARAAVDLASTRGEHGHRAYALRLIGEIAASRDPPDFEEAESRYRDALPLAEELDMRPLQARCHLGLGKLYRRTGRPDEARAELASAVAMLREMGMAFWLPEAERELAEAGG